MKQLFQLDFFTLLKYRRRVKKILDWIEAKAFSNEENFFSRQKKEMEENGWEYVGTIVQLDRLQNVYKPSENLQSDVLIFRYEIAEALPESTWYRHKHEKINDRRVISYFDRKPYSHSIQRCGYRDNKPYFVTLEWTVYGFDGNVLAQWIYPSGSQFIIPFSERYFDPYIEYHYKL